ERAVRTGATEWPGIFKRESVKELYASVSLQAYLGELILHLRPPILSVGQVDDPNALKLIEQHLASLAAPEAHVMTKCVQTIHGQRCGSRVCGGLIGLMEGTAQSIVSLRGACRQRR